MVVHPGWTIFSAELVPYRPTDKVNAIKYASGSNDFGLIPIQPPGPLKRLKFSLTNKEAGLSKTHLHFSPLMTVRACKSLPPHLRSVPTANMKPSR